MRMRLAGLFMIVAGLAGCLCAYHRLTQTKILMHIAKHGFSEGHALASTLDINELASRHTLWTGMMIINAAIAVFGIAITVYSHNRIRRNKEANGRQSDTDYR